RRSSSGDSCLAQVERSALVGRCGGALPQKIAGQTDVLPAEGRRMGEPIVGRRFFGHAQMRDGVGDVGGVPERDRGDNEVEGGGAKLLSLRAAVGDQALLEGADDLRQGMTLLALVEAGMAAPAQFRAFEPV